MKSKALMFTIGEGECLTKLPFSLTKDDFIKNIGKYEKKLITHFNELFQQYMTNSVFVINGEYIASLFFEDGSIFDIEKGYRHEVLNNHDLSVDKEWVNRIYNQS